MGKGESPMTEYPHITRISATEVKAFAECRLAWHYSSANRMNIRPKQAPMALFFGTGIHAALDQYYGKGVDPAQAFKVWWDVELEQLFDTYPNAADTLDFAKLNTNKELGVGMLEHYVVWAKGQDNFKVLFTEIEFEVPIPGTDGLLVGRFDGIVQDPAGYLWILEHKTFSVEPDYRALLIDAQTGKYQWACQELIRLGKLPGVPTTAIVSGAYYNGLRKKLPRKPALLKKGKGLSTAANIDTTYEVYVAELAALNLDPSEYEPVLSALRSKGNTFFRREQIMRTARELDIVAGRLRLEYLEMSRPDVAIFPTPSRDCPHRCQYFDLCLMEQTGGDTSFLINNFFEQRKKKGDVYPYPEAPHIEIATDSHSEPVVIFGRLTEEGTPKQPKPLPF
jgi:hypothetical protein